ncbi:putative UPF0481 protein At3g02645 [Vigna umbellata]|uniref:putative UPF0481 protein At3g02645 n=1 Tax=Vigna umbellata TaxID=87088 RepID=UPI001F5F7896|nr:putative UPF0481 protein At3g02645 [Vigna umbellata]
MWVSEKAENTTDNVEVVINVEKEDEVCVCRVPKSLISGHPEAFSPHFVGLGPYHRTRFELTMTDELKLAAARRIMNHAFEIHLSDVEPFYHQDTLKSYAHEKDMLLKGITIDGLFLLALLNRSLDAQPQQHTYFLTGKRGMPLVNAFGVELTIDAVSRDVFMLENQIPTRVLHQIDQVTTPHGIQSHDLGAKMLRFCKKYCPLAKPESLSKNAEEHSHLLDLMYHLVAPMAPQTAIPNPEVDNEVDPEVGPHPKPDTATTEKPEPVAVMTDKPPESVVVKAEKPDMRSSKTERKGCCFMFRSICFTILIFFMIIGLILWYLLLLIWRIVIGVLLIPYRILAGIVKTVVIVSVMFFSSFLPVSEDMATVIGRMKAPKSKQPEEGKVSTLGNILPKKWVDRIRRYLFGDEDERPAVTIQSVTELDGAGFHFKPANSIKDIRFEARKKELFLPVIKLDENSEVIMRNLVAYESLTRSTYLIFTRYIEIMRAIIDTPEDVNLLVKNEIIVTKLNDKVVADLFNGMSTSIRPTETPELEEVMKKVKRRFEDSQWLHKLVKYVSSSWKILTAIAAFSFFVLNTVQTFCSVYDCASYFSSNLGKLPAVSDNGLISYI